jgi:hypothetical protein
MGLSMAIPPEVSLRLLYTILQDPARSRRRALAEGQRFPIAGERLFDSTLVARIEPASGGVDLKVGGYVMRYVVVDIFVGA